MAKKSAIERNKRILALAEKYFKKRERLREEMKKCKESGDTEAAFAISMKLGKMPRNSSMIRVRNRCRISGRPRGYYRKFGMSRISLRELASSGVLPGVVKSSW